MTHMTDRSAKQAYDRVRYARMKAERLARLPPDPIGMLSLEDRAYIAGIIDGEGSIYVAAVGPERQRSVYPIVCIAMTHLGIMQWLTRTLRAGTLKNHNVTARRLHPHWLPQFRCQLFGKRAQLLCKSLLPFLKVKSEQARLVLSFPVDARIAPGVKIERSDINVRRYALRDQINALNHPDVAMAAACVQPQPPSATTGSSPVDPIPVAA